MNEPLTVERSAEGGNATLSQNRLITILAVGSRGDVQPDLPKSVFLCDSVPHEWLFPRMAAVVHHGGTNTTAEDCVQVSPR